MSYISPYHRDIIWSRLPNLRLSNTLTPKSRHPSWKLKAEQLGQWPNFERKIRDFSSSPRALGQSPPAGGVSLPIQREHYRVANETGITGRIVENAGQMMGEVCEILLLPEFADTQAGKDIPLGCSTDSFPDFILLENPKNTCLVAEVKALDTGRDFEALYGQTARYMDDCKCRYGALVTYNEMVFIRRVGMYTFEKSPVIRHSQNSMPAPNLRVSIREAMLYVAYLAGNGERDARYGLTVGKALTDKSWNPPTHGRTRR